MEVYKLKDISVLKVINANSIGGNQEWFKENKNQMGGCAVVCASDILLYLSLTNHKFKSVYNFRTTNLTMEMYIEHMYKLRKFIHTVSISCIDKNLLGVPFLFMFKRGIRKFCKNYGLSINFNTYKKNLDIVEFIRNALENNIPIAMQQWQNKKLPMFKYHWITIISLIKVEDNITLEVISWGKIYKIKLEDIIYGKGFLKRYRFLYFD